MITVIIKTKKIDDDLKDSAWTKSGEIKVARVPAVGEYISISHKSLEQHAVKRLEHGRELFKVIAVVHSANEAEYPAEIYLHHCDHLEVFEYLKSLD